MAVGFWQHPFSPAPKIFSVNYRLTGHTFSQHGARFPSTLPLFIPINRTWLLLTGTESDLLIIPINRTYLRRKFPPSLSLNCK